MENQSYSDRTDFGGFLTNTAHRLIKEGVSLCALARDWFEGEGNENEEILVQMGIDLANLGRRLLAAKEQLCQACTSKELAEILSFEDALPGKESQ